MTDATDAPKRVEQHIRKIFQLNSDDRLKRVALFLLAHTLVDTHLIARALFKEVSEKSHGAGLPLREIQAIADKVAKETFGGHLKRVREGLPGDTAEIAEGMNDARNALLHWEPDRFSLPVYKGQDVITEAGFRACMDDVLRFIQTVPFETPIAGDSRA